MRQFCATGPLAAAFLSFLLVGIVPLSIARAQQENDAAARNLYADAANAQNGGAFELAVTEWKRFLEKHPKSVLADKAQHYLGVCLLQLKPPKYEEAADAFAKVVAKIPQNKDFSLNEDAYLNLGWCQYSLGKEQNDKSAEWNQKAADTFAAMVKQFPKGKFTDQALYFQAEALYAQGKRKESLAPYDQLVKEHPKSSLRSSGLYALGVTHEELGQYPQAGQAYDLLLKEFPDNQLVTEVRMRKAETLLQAGLALEREKKAAEAQAAYGQAAAMFADAASAQGFKLADHALYRQAFCVLKQDKVVEAGDLYTKLTKDFADSGYVREATMSAGRSYYRGEQFDKAAQAFQQVIAQEEATPPAAKDALAPEAAHWICRIDLKQNEPAKAEALAVKVLPLAAESEYLVELKMDQADALYAQAKRKADSLPLYLKIAADHPQHASAARAVYNAAFTAMEIQQYEEGLKHVATFLAAYKDDPLTPDVQFVAAECNLFLKKYAEAEQGYRALIAANAGHSELPVWQVRLGLCLYLEKKYADTIAAMSPLVAMLPTAAQKAEANYLIGASQFYEGKPAEAVKALEASLAADAKWSKADETLLLLSRSLHAEKKNDEAIAAVKRLLTDFPESRLLPEADYRYGEYAYAKGDYAAAMAHYEAVTAAAPESEFTPYALYGKGWSQLKQQAWPAAAESFTALIDKHGEHQLVPEAIFARGMCRRQAKDHKGAIEDINRFLASNPADADNRASALYERGLAEAALDDNAAAAATFETVLKDNPKWAQAAKVMYELGWTYRGLEKGDQANATFAKLAAEHPDSEFAAEACFHVGESLYEQEKWAEAQKQYALSKEKAGKTDLGEKAAYKLGWAHFKADEFDPALQQFAGQVTEYPQGLLLADGQFMKAECLFKLENYTEALPAYHAANASAAKSETLSDVVKTLILLHGGQSAGQVKKWDESLVLLTPIVAEYKDSPYLAEAQFEIGQAQKNLGKSAEALAAWERAATLSRGEIGARARFEMGELQFAAKKFPEAIVEFQRVMFGYGGDNATDDVKPWQAKSAVEAGRCAETQIETTTGAERVKWITDAKRSYTYVVEKHPQDAKLVDFAKTRLAALAKLQ
ncbi:MAG: tetratricopeptide repeat protein [Pirellulaceae bacterium]